MKKTVKLLPKLVVLTFFLLAVPTFYWSQTLFKHLDPDLTALLPKDSKFLHDLNSARERIQAFEGIVILTAGATPNQNRKFQDELGQTFKNVLDPSQFSVHYEVKEEIKFFGNRKGLFLSVEEIQKIESNFKKALERRKNQNDKNGLSLIKDLYQTVKGGIELEVIRSRFSSVLDRFIRFPEGTFATPDFSFAAIIVTSKTPALGYQNAVQALSKINGIVQTVKQKPEYQGVVIRYTGEIPCLIEDQVSIISDIHHSSWVVVIAILALLLFFFRNLLGIISLFVSVLSGVMIAFSLTWLKFQTLNANSAFMASIVIGNGINFGILILSRYSELCQKEPKPLTNERKLELIQESLRSNFLGTLMAAMAAGVAYTVVAMTDFRGFSQFGFLGATGVFSCWITAYTLFPALLSFLPAPNLKVNTKVKSKAEVSAKNRRRVSVLVALTVLICGASLFKNRNDLLESNFLNLRDQKSIESGAIAAFKYLNAIFGKAITSPMVLTSSREKAKEFSNSIRTDQTAEVKKAAISSAFGYDDLIPANQSERLNELKKLKKILNGPDGKLLTPPERKTLEDLTRAIHYGTFTENEIPLQARQTFTEVDGTIGRIVMIESPKLMGATNPQVFITLVGIINQKIKAVDPNALLIGSAVFVSEISRAMIYEIKRTSLWVLIGVIIAVIFIFRKPKEIRLILLSWSLGLVWFLGLTSLFGIKINFVNFLAIPITTGIGIDYIANLVRKPDLAGKATQAVVVCSLTTIIGYGSLLFAGNNGLKSFGQLAILGEFTCIFAAFLCFIVYRNQINEESK